MLEDDDYVYFFLREQAVEYINCGKVLERLSHMLIKLVGLEGYRKGLVLLYVI